MPSKTEVNDVPYIAARAEVADRNASLIIGKRNWMLFAFGLLAVSSILSISLGYAAVKPAPAPKILLVDKFGNAIDATYREFTPDDMQQAKREFLVQYITQIRTVTPDTELQLRYVNYVYNHTGEQRPAKAFLDKHFPANDPFKRAETERAYVDVTSVLPLTKDSWQADWRETIRDKNGSEKSTQVWRATFTIEVSRPDPKNHQAQRVNPLGLYTTDISWQQLQ